MSELDEHLKRHRKRILDREEATIRELITAYDNIERELKASFKKLQQQIKAAQDAGEIISPSWFYRERRLKSLLDQVKTQIGEFGAIAARITSREQSAAMDIAVEQAGEMLRFVAGRGDIGAAFNPRVVENAVGMMGDGSPIIEYYRENLAPKVAEMIRMEVIKAAAQGTSFNTIADRLVRTGQITRTRALSTARTEVNRVRRETTRQWFLQNKDLITGWEWVSAKSARTCPACLALDGKIFRLSQPFPQHINCRCTLIAIIDGVERPKRVLGPEWFDQQSDDVKAAIIGVDGLAAYKEKIIKLKDFIGYAQDVRFGLRTYTKKLGDILKTKPVAERIIRTPKKIKVVFRGNAGEILEEALGRKLTPNEIGGLVGALDGSKIEAANSYSGMQFRVSHPLVAAQERILSIDGRGRLFMHNHYFRTSRTAPEGIGLKSFATQVHHAEKFGIQYIDTDAVGDFKKSQDENGWNGYYSWPRMGYNAELNEDDWEKFPLTYRGIPDLNSLFEQQNGNLVWKHFGTGREMIFDLDPTTPSWRILRKYLQERGFEVEF